MVFSWSDCDRRPHRRARAPPPRCASVQRLRIRMRIVGAYTCAGAHCLGGEECTKNPPSNTITPFNYGLLSNRMPRPEGLCGLKNPIGGNGFQKRT